MHVLVVGGAGYIGSHMVLMLAERGHRITVLDNLGNGHRDAVLAGDLVVGDLADDACLGQLFGATHFDAVLHFASLIQVAESVAAPGRYYRNNVACTLNLLGAMVRHKVPHLVFSSTAAVYGTPQYVPIDEAHPTVPINPYGQSKRMVEHMLADYERAHGLRSVCLRYFNAAGADPQGRIGERHEPETHLLPRVLQAAAGRSAAITVYGRDYDTPDGTCIRDYVHVVDLCDAHLRALDYLRDGGDSTIFNLGNGNGFSVDAVIACAARVSARPVPVRDGARRPGDPARLVADATRARQVLGWRPAYPDLETIIAHAWRWESGNRPG